MSISAATLLMRRALQFGKAKYASLLFQTSSYVQQIEDASAKCEDISGQVASSICDDRYSSIEMENQENMISKKCELMYTRWRRRRSSPLVPSFEKPCSEVSSDGKFVIGRIGKEGGYLELKDGDVQLYIPPGAMPRANEEDVFMYVDTVRYNSMNYDVVICGPPGIKFSSSVLLRFPNLKARHEEDQMPTRVKLSVQKLGEPMKWRYLDTSNDGLCFLEDGDVILHLKHFTGVKVDAEVQTISITEEDRSLCKPIYISAFLEQEDQRYFSMRLFCSTYSALTFVQDDESLNDSRKLGNPVKLGSYQSHDLVNVKIEDYVDCRPKPSDYVICVGDVVSDVGYIYRQFLLDCSSSEASMTFRVNVGDETVHIVRVKVKGHCGTKASVKLDDEYQEIEFTPSPLPRPILSTEVRRSLSIELDFLRVSQRPDEKQVRLCDYRGLACLMGMPTSYIHWIGPGAPKNCPTSTSPTILLLNTWEISCRKRQLKNCEALCELGLLLEQLDHNVCIKMVDEYIRNKGKPKQQFRPRPRSLSVL